MVKKVKNPNENLERRLDALIRMYIEASKRTDDKFTDEQAAKILYAVGLTPTEIAKIFGKESRTDIATYLYGKRKRKLRSES